jgi:hypothetical protein
VTRPRPLTEQEWLRCAYPGTMLTRLRTGDARKLRLFVCACCARLWKFLDDPRSREAVRAAEQWADGMIGRAELKEKLQAAEAAEQQARHYYAARAAKQAAMVRKDWVVNTAWAAAQAKGEGEASAHAKAQEELFQCHLIRDIFGNPFRPVTFKPTWLTPAILGLAQDLYQNRKIPDGTFDTAHLSILADALEDAGCDNLDILEHCRSEGPHVRGCWVVDRLLEKVSGEWDGFLPG